MLTAQEIDDRLTAILREVTECETVGDDPDLALFETGLLDSLGTVSLIAALADVFQLEVAPSDIDRAAWATPALLAADVRRRLAG